MDPLDPVPLAPAPKLGARTECGVGEGVVGFRPSPPCGQRDHQSPEVPCQGANMGTWEEPRARDQMLVGWMDGKH